MSNRSVPFFRTYLKVLGGTISYAETARVLRISEDWLYKCLSASKAASASPELPSVFLFESEEGDGEPRWFHEHVRSAVSNSIEAIEAAARSRALHGTYTTAKFQGRTVYQIDPDLEELGFEGPETYRRDENGKPLPEQVWTPPSTDLVLGILAAHSKRYRKQSSVDVNLNARMSGGVQVIGSKPAPQISAPLPVLEIVQDAAEPKRAAGDEEPPADFAEIADDDQADLGVSDTAPGAPVDDEADAEPATPAPAPMIRTATPPDLAPAGNPLIMPRNGRPLSDLERDLLSKLPSTLNRKA